MNVRLLLLLLPMTLTYGFAQTGLYGPVTGQLNADDAAPDFIYTKALSAPELAPPSLQSQ